MYSEELKVCILRGGDETIKMNECMTYVNAILFYCYCDNDKEF